MYTWIQHWTCVHFIYIYIYASLFSVRSFLRDRRHSGRSLWTFGARRPRRLVRRPRFSDLSIARNITLLLAFSLVESALLSDPYSPDSVVKPRSRIPSHAGVSGNEMADYFAVSTNKNLRCPTVEIPAAGFLAPVRLKRNQAWQSKWASTAANFGADDI